jgi:hypothetical protein
MGSRFLSGATPFLTALAVEVGARLPLSPLQGKPGLNGAAQLATVAAKPDSTAALDSRVPTVIRAAPSA